MDPHHKPTGEKQQRAGNLPGSRSPETPAASASPAVAAKKQKPLNAKTAAEEAIDQARLERLAKIKKAVEDGTYHISNEDVARKLIEHMLEPKK